MCSVGAEELSNIGGISVGLGGKLALQNVQSFITSLNVTSILTPPILDYRFMSQCFLCGNFMDSCVTTHLETLFQKSALLQMPVNLSCWICYRYHENEEFD